MVVKAFGTGNKIEDEGTSLISNSLKTNSSLIELDYGCEENLMNEM